MKKIFLFFVSLGIILGLFLGVRSEMLKNNSDVIDEEKDSGDNYIHELKIPIMEIDTLNPILTYNVQVSNLLGLIYEPLVEIGKDDSLEACLATEWAEKDDTNWIIKLRRGVKWHNGNNFTSDDVVFTFGQLVSGDISSPYRDNLKNVISVEAIDDYSVSVTLSQKDEFFVYKLAIPIIPEYYFKNGEILNENKNNIPVGTGPYKYISTNVGKDLLKLEFNNAWWNNGGEIRLNTIYLYKYSTYGEAIKAYKSADVDLIVTTMSDWEKKFGTIGNNVYSYESSVFDTIIPNIEKLALSDASVRKAILFAINRENIVSKVFSSNATVVDLPIHTRSKNFLSSIQSEYDLDKAKQVLINAGWAWNGSWSKSISGTSCELKFNLLVNKENDEHVAAAEAIKSNLADLGVPITIKEVGWDDYQKAIGKGKFDFAISSFDIKNELTILEILEENGSMNYSKYASEKMNVAIEKVRKWYTAESMQELQNIYKSDTPYIGLYFRNNTLLTNKSVKGSIEPTWFNPYEGVITWCK